MGISPADSIWKSCLSILYCCRDSGVVVAVVRELEQMTSQHFRDLYLGTFEPTEEDRRLYELAEGYERHCESFDRTVCTGPMGRDGILPANAHELAAVGRNAAQVYPALMIEVTSLGFDARQFRAAVREVQHRRRT